ncbi:MAG: acetyl-CoA carboxylase biotin carboxylase subunit [Chloroflexi bacterium]|nr:acetyl-CoA carboxylase biotin carboxylase subunit [Chloroflexota bacterium]
MFQKILIANRGEIAVRIIQACQEMGIATVAVYSEADAAALHTMLADEAICIGPSAPGESYLRIDKIVAVAQQTNCDAIHPGYGFLAENADFAVAVKAANLTFIGPSAAAMRIMGSKTMARAAVQAAGVPVIPGYQASNADADLIAAAQALGFPVLVKASAGGGGKGIRVVREIATLPTALQAARREAFNAFGDDQLYLEKLIEDAHHIEFQIFGDQFGNIVHLFERECSIQRRHQKIIEETPSPLLDANLRQRMGETAVAAARAVQYLNAGTIEFLVDSARNFYFLEMNTRLQVEHPITELTTGLDLVQTQIRIAAGERLPFQQADLTQRGHALECRIYAEDPANDFLPAIGQIWQIEFPHAPGVRIDPGIASGGEVTIYYDPLLAKLSVLGATRQAAIAKLQWALRHTVILGNVITNITFLRAVLNHPTFQQATSTTAFIDQTFASWQPSAGSPPVYALIAAALVGLQEKNRSSPNNAPPEMLGDPYSPWHHPNHFRMGSV